MTFGDIRAPRRAPIRLLLVLPVVLLLAACLTEQEQQAYDRLGALRAAHGRAPLDVHEELQTKAHAWAEELARRGTIAHSRLSDGITAPWKALSETVSSATTLDGAFDAQVASKSHKASLLDSRFTHVGTGVAQDASGRYYLVFVFMRL